MDAYIYQADIYCDRCAELKMQALEHQGIQSDGLGDSDQWPQGPYSDGGGEADYPQHCRSCGIFLQNPLTDEGRKYARDKIAEHHKSARGAAIVIQQWEKHYDLTPD